METIPRFYCNLINTFADLINRLQHKLTILLITCWGLFFYSCSTPTAVVNQNLSYTYDKDQTYLHPQYVLFNKNDSITSVYVRISASELLFAQSPNSRFPFSKYSVSLRLQNNLENRTLVDSSSVSIVFSDSIRAEFYYTYLEIKARKGGKYALIAQFSDNNRNQFIQSQFPLERSRSFNLNDMMITAVGDTMPLFAQTPDSDQTIRLRCNYPPTTGAYVAELYRKEFPLPAPPFAMVEPAVFDINPDSTFYITDENLNNLTLKSKGIYWIKRKSDDNGGFCIFRYYDGYPNINSSDNMIAPLRYLSSKQEFREITEGSNKRAGMETFWTECAGSQDRARELIKIYYNRVKEANVYFNSYLEGWKTDRGLVYVIFGPPNIVYRNSSNEQWIYGAENNMMSLSFTFLKMDNPFTDNDYSLSRNGTYKNTWYQAVDSWRQGRVWLDN